MTDDKANPDGLRFVASGLDAGYTPPGVANCLRAAAAEIERLRAALEPFTAGCFWDNGDLTVDRGAPSLDDVKHAFWVLRKSL